MSLHTHLQTTKIYTLEKDKELFNVDSDVLYNSTTNWKYNRPPDERKVEEITQYIHDNKKPPDGIIYIAELIDSETKTIRYVCYDGNHRREALKYVPKMKVLVQLRTNITDEDIKDEFLRLNKTTPVPELYITDEIDEGKKEKIKISILNTIKYFAKKYPKHFSSSSRPKDQI